MRKYLTGGLLAAACLIVPAPAGAAEKCLGAGVGGVGEIIACYEVETDPGLNGTTIAPRIAVDCRLTGASIEPRELCDVEFLRPGDGVEVEVGRTGFVPNPSFPAPCVDPQTGTIRSDGGTVGTLYVDGAIAKINVRPFVVGDPAGC